MTASEESFSDYGRSWRQFCRFPSSQMPKIPLKLNMSYSLPFAHFFLMFSLASCSQPVICEYNPKNILMSFFARLYGSYEDLQIGQVSEALVDFTGGVNTRIKLAQAPPDLWDILTRATYSRSLMGCQTHLGVRLGVTSNGFTAKSLSRPVTLCSAGHCDSKSIKVATRGFL